MTADGQAHRHGAVRCLYAQPSRLSRRPALASAPRKKRADRWGLNFSSCCLRAMLANFTRMKSGGRLFVTGQSNGFDAHRSEGN